MTKFWTMSVALLFVMSSTLSAQPPSVYFTIVPGDVPVLLTAPHGGTFNYPFDERSCTGGQSCALDTNTRQLTLAASDEFFALTGSRPYIVVARGHRKYIDLNRSDAGGTPNDAYDDPAAEPFYDYYHNAVQGFIDDIRLEFGRGLLLDIHGQSAIPASILRGTVDGLTTTEMLNEFGPVSLNGPNSIFGTFDAMGHPVEPDVNIPFVNQVEVPAFNGGYTVQAYGSHQSNGMDAIQIEFGYDFRGGTAWEATAVDLAIATRNFYEAYLEFEPGDFDGDVDVDGSDFLVWQSGLGQFSGTATRTDGDANGDGLVDDADLLLWQNHFGNSGSEPAAVAVPEPDTLVLVLIGLALLVRVKQLT